MKKSKLTDNELANISPLEAERYENIFNVYKDGSYFFYNILNKINLPDNIDDSFLEVIQLNRSLPWTTLSFQIYGSINLWWIIFLLNRPDNIFIAESGKEYKYIRPEFTGIVLSDIQSQINK